MNPLEFCNLQSAIDYHSNCPICGALLEIDKGKYSRQIESFPSNNEKITFYLGDDQLTVGLTSNQIEIKLNQMFNYQDIYCAGDSTSFKLSGISYGIIPTSGSYIHDIIISCIKCCQFSYVVKLLVDIDSLKLSGIYLELESITIENDDIVHEVRNIFTLNKTEYISFSKNGGTKITNLPLVQLDFLNPQDTINRIRKLILFS